MNRPYINFQIDKLETEFERAREERDGDALGQLKVEAAKRTQTARVVRLSQMIADELEAPISERAAAAGRTEEQAVSPSSGIDRRSDAETYLISRNFKSACASAPPPALFFAIPSLLSSPLLWWRSQGR